MANIKSAKKRAKQEVVRRQRNNARRSTIKTATKKVFAAIEQNDIDAAKTLLMQAEAQIARARGKGLFHKNTAARKISVLARRVSALSRSA